LDIKSPTNTLNCWKKPFAEIRNTGFGVIEGGNINDFKLMKHIFFLVTLLLGLTQAHEKAPEHAGDKNASEATKKEFTFISPGEGRYLFQYQ